MGALRPRGCFDATRRIRLRRVAQRDMPAGLSARRGVTRCAGNLPNTETGRSPVSAASSGNSRDARASPILSSNSCQLSRPSAKDSWRTLIARSRSATEASMRDIKGGYHTHSSRDFPVVRARAVWTMKPPVTCAGQGGNRSGIGTVITDRLQSQQRARTPLPVRCPGQRSCGCREVRGLWRPGVLAGAVTACGRGSGRR
jgi:hypothetical protein